MLDTVETPDVVLMTSNSRPNRMRGGVRRTGDHAIDDVVVHQHGAEIRDVTHDFTCPIGRHALVLTQLEILVRELLGQIAGLGTDNECVRDVDTELGGTGTDFGLFAQDRQVGDLTLQQPWRP